MDAFRAYQGEGLCRGSVDNEGGSGCPGGVGVNPLCEFFENLDPVCVASRPSLSSMVGEEQKRLCGLQPAAPALAWPGFRIRIEGHPGLASGSDRGAPKA